MSSDTFHSEDKEETEGGADGRRWSVFTAEAHPGEMVLDLNVT